MSGGIKFPTFPLKFQDTSLRLLQRQTFKVQLWQQRTLFMFDYGRNKEREQVRAEKKGLFRSADELEKVNTPTSKMCRWAPAHLQHCTLKNKTNPVSEQSCDTDLPVTIRVRMLACRKSRKTPAVSAFILFCMMIKPRNSMLVSIRSLKAKKHTFQE